MKNHAKFQQPTRRSVTAIVEEVDQNRLNSFFRQELGFYNNVVSVFEGRTRAFPKTIASITSEQAQLFCEMAKHNLNIKDVTKNANEWPEKLAGLQGAVWNKKNEMLLSEGMVLMYEQMLRDRWTLIPETKKMIVKAVLDFFKNQAEILSAPVKSELVEVAYKTPPANLMKQEFFAKRHAQIPKSEVRYKWDNENNQTILATPYNVRPILLPNFNLNEYTGWNMLILKQESCRNVAYDTPWMADFRQSSGYDLKYNDVGITKKKR